MPAPVIAFSLNVTRSPYFELWIASLAGICIGLWPQNPWIWASCVFVFFISKPNLVFGIVIVGAVARVNIATENEVKRHIQNMPTYENVHLLPRELIAGGAVSRSGNSDSEISPLGRIKAVAIQVLNSDFGMLDGFRKAVILGATREIPPKVWDPMNYLGLSHLLVISGSHISIILLLIMGLARWSNFSRLHFLPRWLALLLAGLFILICNLDISIFRAFICFAIIAIGSIKFPGLHRLRSSERLSFLGAVLAWGLPLSAVSPTYILSFGTTWALLRAGEISDPTEWKLKFIAPFMMVLPLCGILGLGVHPLSFLANMILGPVFVFLLVPLSLASLVFKFLEPWANSAIESFFRCVQWSADFLARHWPAESFGPNAHLVLLFVIVVLFQFRALSLRARRNSMILAGVLFCILSVSPVHFNAHSIGVDLEVLDIGQGDGLLLNIEGTKIVIDGGGPRIGVRQLLPKLKERYRSQIDLWILSHFDQDHRGNFQEIEARTQIGEIWVPRLNSSATANLLRTHYLNRIRTMDRGPIEICTKKHCLTCFSVNGERSAEKVGNEDSAVCVLSTRIHREIEIISGGDLPGGLEVAVLGKLDELGLKVPEKGILALKVGHHGSKTSSSAQFIDRLNPRNVIITAGRNNQYGFPSPIVLARLASQNIRVFRVDALGGFKLHFDN